MSEYIQTIGYNGPQPLAIIFWRKGNEHVCKTICYDESEVINMYERHNTLGDMYNELTASIHYIPSEKAIAV